LAVPLALALSSCSDVFLKKETPYQVMLEPAQLGYEVDDQGKITVVGNTAYVQVDAGAPGGYLVGYEYVVVDDSGNEFLPGSSLGSGSLAVEVPPGREEVNGQLVYVPKRSEVFRFSMDGEVAKAHLSQSQGAPLNWRYKVTWRVVTSNGGRVVWTQEYQIKYPLKP